MSKRQASVGQQRGQGGCTSCAPGRHKQVAPGRHKQVPRPAAQAGGSGAPRTCGKLAPPHPAGVAVVLPRLRLHKPAGCELRLKHESRECKLLRSQEAPAIGHLPPHLRELATRLFWPSMSNCGRWEGRTAWSDPGPCPACSIGLSIKRPYAQPPAALTLRSIPYPSNMCCRAEGGCRGPGGSAGSRLDAPPARQQSSCHAALLLTISTQAHLHLTQLPRAVPHILPLEPRRQLARHLGRHVQRGLTGAGAVAGPPRFGRRPRSRCAAAGAAG